METSIYERFSQKVNVFHGIPLPEESTLVGYSALINVFNLSVPLPRRLSAIGAIHRIKETSQWHLLTPRHLPSPDLAGHLTFALKHEGLDLCVLKALFRTTGPGPIQKLVVSSPTGIYARRAWFLYEWLLDERLDVPDAAAGPYIDIVDPKQQVCIAGKPSRRHRVRNNLPGIPAFCPMIFLTETLQEFLAKNLAHKASAVVAEVPADLMARAAAFLLLKDSKSSYEIEGEHPPQERIQRWGRAIAEAGNYPLSLLELLRLQKIVIGDPRFVALGLRSEGGFVGEHDRTTGAPIPDHISAKPEDLENLVAGLIQYDRLIAPKLNPVLAAAALAFGFVYIHPYQDGNGRLHRYLIHHVLAERGFNPPGIVFPISAALLNQIGVYREVLETYSKRLLPLIEWEPTRSGNVQVANETADFYRYFDATPHAEFLFECVERTIMVDLPAETNFLASYDRFIHSVELILDMPESTLNLLFRFLRQNNGKLSRRAREREFKKLTGAEVAQIEVAFAEAFSRNGSEVSG